MGKGMCVSRAGAEGCGAGRRGSQLLSDIVLGTIPMGGGGDGPAEVCRQWWLNKK